MEDIYYNIFILLPFKDIYSCSQVNKQFNKVTKFEQLWKHLYLSHYQNYDFLNNYYETCKLYKSL